MEKSSTGLAANVAGLLCYVLGWVSGLVFVLIERESRFVRFHAMQSIYVFGLLTIVYIVVRWIPPIVVFELIWLVRLLWIIVLVLLMVKAYQGVMYKLPWLGNLAEKRSG